MPILISLYIEFFKIGLFSLGGGLATIPFLYQLTVSHPQWIIQSDVANMIAISQSTPGPMGVNMATYTGFFVNGISGSIIASLGLVTPSVIIVILISKFLKQFDQKWYVKNGFYGLRPTVLALITYAVSNIFITSLFNKTHLRITEAIIFVIIFFLYRKFNKIHPLVWILIGAILGLIFKLPS